MGWRKNNFKSIMHGICSSSDPVVWNPKKGYRNINLRSILLSRFMVPFIAFSSLAYVFAPTKPPQTDNYQETVKIEVKKDIEIKNDGTWCDLESEKCNTQVSLKKDNYNPDNKNEIIRADLLENTGTTIKGTNILRYTEKGIIVPSDLNYSIIINGKEYLPDSRGFIEIPKGQLSKKVRFARINPSSDNPEKRYLASFSTRIKEEKERDVLPKYRKSGIFADETNKNSVLIGANGVLEQRILDNKPTERGLDRIVGENPKEEPALLASLEENQGVDNLMSSYFSERKNRRDLATSIVMALNSGYKIDSLNTFLRRNNDGYIRSDSRIIKAIKYGKNQNLSFTEMVLRYTKQGMSDKKIAEEIRKDTVRYVRDGLGMNVNEKQVREARIAAGWITRKMYEKDPVKYDTLGINLTIYDKSSTIFIKNQP